MLIMVIVTMFITTLSSVNVEASSTSDVVVCDFTNDYPLEVNTDVIKYVGNPCSFHLIYMRGEASDFSEDWALFHAGPVPGKVKPGNIQFCKGDNGASGGDHLWEVDMHNDEKYHVMSAAECQGADGPCYHLIVECINGRPHIEFHINSGFFNNPDNKITGYGVDEVNMCHAATTTAVPTTTTTTPTTTTTVPTTTTTTPTTTTTVPTTTTTTPTTTTTEAVPLTFDCDANNPCNPLLVPNVFFYAHHDPTNFIQCNAGNCYVLPCPPGNTWDDDAKMCN